jgi:hypothetical protein
VADEHDHHDHDHRPHGKGGSRRTTADYVRDFFSNWSSFEGSTAEKLKLALRNRAQGLRPPFRACCGHPGEPGC